MKSVCLKTNNEEIISCIIRGLEEDFEDIIISSNKFKIYKNVIIHYCGNNEKNFLIKLSELISNIIEIFYEEKILDKIITDNYCYFEAFEKEVILKISEKIIEIQEASFKYKKEILRGLIYEYFLDNNKVMVLE
jgi:spore coat polysaccharide biosynthesis predicted glycosyltransferase SpsG